MDASLISEAPGIIPDSNDHRRTSAASSSATTITKISEGRDRRMSLQSLGQDTEKGFQGKGNDLDPKLNSSRPGSEGFEGAGTTASPFVVRWLDGETENPLKWRPLKKWLIVATVAMSTLW